MRAVLAIGHAVNDALQFVVLFVLFDPSAPQDAHLDSAWVSAVGPGILLVFAFATAGLGVSLLGFALISLVFVR